MTSWTAAQIPDLSGRTAIVTGANGGLGYATAVELARHGAAVILACRNRSRAEAALQRMREEAAGASIELMMLDVGDLDSIRAFVQEFQDRHDRLDLLINNAGIVMTPKSLTTQGFERHIGINFLGPFALTGLLLELISQTADARIINISSIAHRFGQLDVDDLNWERRPYTEKGGYGASKVAILSWTFELQRRLNAAGINASSLAAHPGYAATNLANSDMKMARSWLGRQALALGNALIANSAERSALCTLYAAVASEAQGGDYIGPNGMGEMRGFPKKVSSTATARDAGLAAQLWDRAQQLTGVSYL